MTLLGFGLLKVLTAIVGTVVTLAFLLSSIFRGKRAVMLRMSGVTFSLTIAAILILTGIEFMLYPENQKLDQIVLSAHRQAPIGAIWLGLYSDSTWEIGNSPREINTRGIYSIHGDSLELKTLSGTEFYKGDSVKWFVFQDDDLVEVKNTGIRSLRIYVNKLSSNSISPLMGTE